MNAAGSGTPQGNAPSNGRAPFHRGLVLRPPYSQHALNGVRFEMDDPLELRLGALYWDKIASPQVSPLVQTTRDHTILDDEGVLMRPDSQYKDNLVLNHKNLDVAPLVRAHVEAFNDLERLHPGRWALSQGNRKHIVDMNFAAKDGGMLVELVQAIPVPLDNCPIDNVLRFKEKHRSELLRLRMSIDETHQSVVEAEDQQAALIRSAQEIEMACLDLIKASSSWFRYFKLTDLQSIFNKSAKGVVEAALTGQFPSVSLAIGSIQAGIKITNDISMRRRALRDSPYLYIAKFNKKAQSFNG